MKQVNLLMGRNNCGKTSVLESLFLLTGLGNLQLFFSVPSFRFETDTSPDGMRCFFHNMNFNIPFKLSAVTEHLGEKNNRQIECTAAFSEISSLKAGISSLDGTAGGSSESQSFSRLLYNASFEKGAFVKGTLDYQEEHNQWVINATNEHGSGYPIRSYFLINNTVLHELNKRLDAVVRMNQMSLILSPLKEMDPDIKGIQLGGLNNIYIDVGITPLSPISTMGDGIRRMLAIIATIVSEKGGVVLIDEIENGFHHSAMKVLWKTLLSAAQEFDVQIIATTHSLECANALAASVLEPTGTMTNNVSFFRIRREDSEHHVCIPMDAEVINANAEMGMEVRG